MTIANELTAAIEKLENQRNNSSNPETQKAIDLLIRELYEIAIDVTLLQSDPKQVIKSRGKKTFFNL
jgi:hypothetical protein